MDKSGNYLVYCNVFRIIVKTLSMNRRNNILAGLFRVSGREYLSVPIMSVLFTQHYIPPGKIIFKTVLVGEDEYFKYDGEDITTTIPEETSTQYFNEYETFYNKESPRLWGELLAFGIIKGLRTFDFTIHDAADVIQLLHVVRTSSILPSHMSFTYTPLLYDRDCIHDILSEVPFIQSTDDLKGTYMLDPSVEKTTLRLLGYKKKENPIVYVLLTRLQKLLKTGIPVKLIAIISYYYFNVGVTDPKVLEVSLSRYFTSTQEAKKGVNKILKIFNTYEGRVHS